MELLEDMRELIYRGETFVQLDNGLYMYYSFYFDRFIKSDNKQVIRELIKRDIKEGF